MTSRGLSAPHSSPFGDPEILPIMSARAGEVSRIHFGMVEAGSSIAVAIPAAALAVEISCIAWTEQSTVRYLAGPDVDEPIGGIIRIVPAGGQVIEYRHVRGGDTLAINCIDGTVDIEIHAHLGS